MMTDAASAKVRAASHELNNLCSTILGFAALAEEMDHQHSAIAAYLMEIKLSTESVAAIARQLREISQELQTST